MEFRNITSPKENIICSVPQRINIVYVNDISNTTSLNILSFADHMLLHNYTTKQMTNSKKLNDWFCAKILNLNAKKTKYILFKPNITHPSINNRYIILNERHVDRVGNK